MFPASRVAAKRLAIHAVNLTRQTDCWEILPCGPTAVPASPPPHRPQGQRIAAIKRQH
ncbi:hypothetical protein BV22DRAFT_1040371 [Leucogyrophana mollusca]|uniref:Uncharacterized protein n=1 Tax=Leucogyrophana mollusca TaxID=85980 RepID=A0ACB8B4A0_9AGAM|nr:hypothetical protein BV22DRAFT_1040371 [Leucogyrophana mollusca]